MLPEFKFNLAFAKMLGAVENFDDLKVCARKSDVSEVAVERVDIITMSGVRRVTEVMMVAERFIQGRMDRFLELLPCFSTFSGRLVAIEGFVEKHPLRNAVAAVTLIELIRKERSHICPDCTQRTFAIVMAIREMAQKFIKPTPKSTAEELAAMAKLVKGDTNEEGKLLAPAMKQIVEIANAAIGFKKLDDILLVSRALPHFETANCLMRDFIKKVGISTVAEAEAILASTNIASEAGSELMTEVIRQMVKKGPKEFDIAELLAKTNAFDQSMMRESTEPPSSLPFHIWWPGRDRILDRFSDSARGAFRFGTGLDDLENRLFGSSEPDSDFDKDFGPGFASEKPRRLFVFPINGEPLSKETADLMARIIRETLG